ncbi:MAG: biotin/lipoyl-binding protein [Deltaproteobacteria bacterium]|nr:biotin/lipoyl-binding protein [Deltaproteobacteria bacterium]PWB65767.1 MAG: secretion protein HlyD [Deltaproteobacteria bacterium]
MKKTVPLIAALTLLFAVTAVIAMKPVRHKEPPPIPPPAKMLESAVGAVGLVEPNTENIAISTAVPGLVTSVFARSGDKVKAGQPLFSLDDRDLRAELLVRQSELRLARAELERLVRLPRPEEVPPAEARVQEAQANFRDARIQQERIESVGDRRAIREEDLQRRRQAAKAAEARLDEAKAELGLLKAGPWQRDLEIARAKVDSAESRVRRAATEIERLTMRAPVDGEVLQSNVRPGQFAPTGSLGTPLMILGSVSPLHVRVDVEEHDAWRVREGAGAVASPRGNGSLKIPLRFVRIEPYVVPKKSLTGDSTERVDTRVLQVIYRVAAGNSSFFVGQQVDVYIEAQASSGASPGRSGPATGGAR